MQVSSKNTVPVGAPSRSSASAEVTQLRAVDRSGARRSSVWLAARFLGALSLPAVGAVHLQQYDYLYTFYLDKPGKLGGDGFDDAFGGQRFTWHVVHADTTASSSRSDRSGGNGSQGY